MPKSEARQQFLTDVMITAAEGGINYWAGVLSYKWDAPYDERHVTVVEMEELPDGWWSDPETGLDNLQGVTAHRITPDMLASALRRWQEALSEFADLGKKTDAFFYASAGNKELLVANATNFEEGDYDAGDADCLLQIAAFGKIIYG